MKPDLKALAIAAAASIASFGANAGYVTFDVSAVGIGTLGGPFVAGSNFQQTFNFDYAIAPTFSAAGGPRITSFSGPVASTVFSSGYQPIATRLGTLDDPAVSTVDFRINDFGLGTFSIGSTLPQSSVLRSFALSIFSPLGVGYTTDSTAILNALFGSGATFGFVERASSGTDALGYLGVARVASFSASMVAAPVPEPETWVMLLAGLGLLGSMRSRGRRMRADTVAAAV